jgi:hypothetical protein
MSWGFYEVTDRLTRNGTTYEVGGPQKPAFDDDSPEVSLLQSQGVLGSRAGDAPDPTVIDGSELGLPDRGILPGQGLIHRKEDSDDWQFADEILSED